jgi:hypothetical protein
MKLWVLTIILLNTTIKHKYKFLKEDNCRKVGRELSKIKKTWKYSCKLKEL